MNVRQANKGEKKVEKGKAGKPYFIQKKRINRKKCGGGEEWMKRGEMVNDGEKKENESAKAKKRQGAGE